jgi:hypothetical protein
MKQKYQERIRSELAKIKCCLIMSPLFSAYFSGANVVDSSHSVCSDDDDSLLFSGGVGRSSPSPFPC